MLNMKKNPKSNKGDKAEKMVVWCASLVDSQDKYDGEKHYYNWLWRVPVSFNSFSKLGVIISIERLLYKLKLDFNFVFQYKICYTQTIFSYNHFSQEKNLLIHQNLYISQKTKLKTNWTSLHQM